MKWVSLRLPRHTDVKGKTASSSTPEDKDGRVQEGRESSASIAMEESQKEDDTPSSSTRTTNNPLAVADSEEPSPSDTLSPGEKRLTQFLKGKVAASSFVNPDKDEV